MKPARSLQLVLAAVLSIPAFSPLPAQDAAPPDPADRLLEGELLEVASGDIEAALAVYSALLERQDVPESVRARALLYTARCYRKQGKLQAARELLERLVETHRREAAVLREAQVFLAELREGRPARREFDWLGELERNPAIQARVFDLAMDLVQPAESKAVAQRAERQLLALGTVSVPVLEKLLETSRDALHRQHLAIVLVRLGRSEHLGAALADLERTGPLAALDRLVAAASTLPELDRERILEALESIRADAGGELGAHYADRLRIAVSDREALLADLESAEPRLALHAAFLERVGPWLGEDPRFARALAARVLDADWPVGSHLAAFDALRDAAAEDVLEPAHYVAALELYWRKHEDHLTKNRFALGPWMESAFESLEGRGAFDALSEVAAGSLRGWLAAWFRSRYAERRRDGEATLAEKIARVPPGWAAVLRAMPEPHGGPGGARLPSGIAYLHWIAEQNDAFVPDWAEVLAARSRLVPEYTGYSGVLTRSGDWRPSRAYVKGMLEVLADGDAIAQAIAADALAHARKEDAEATAAALERLAAEAADPRLREVAVAAMLRLAAYHAPIGPRAVAALAAEFQRRLAWDEVPASWEESPLASLDVLRTQRLRVVPRRPASARFRGVGRRPAPVDAPQDTLRWTVGLESDGRKALYPHVLAAIDSQDAEAFHEWYIDASGASVAADQVVLPDALWEQAGEAGESFQRALLLAYSRSNSSPPAGIARYSESAADAAERFVRQALHDRRFDPELRRNVLATAAQSDGEFASRWASWFDWPEFVTSDDPFFPRILADKALAERVRGAVRELPEPAPQATYLAALDHPDSGVRNWAIGELAWNRLGAEPLDHAFARAMKGSDPELRRVLAENLAKDLEPEAARALLLRMLREEESPEPIRKLLWHLGAHSDLEVIRRLTEFIEHRDPDVRKMALASLGEIRARIEAQTLWKEFIEFRKQAEER